MNITITTSVVGAAVIIACAALTVYTLALSARIIIEILPKKRKNR